MDKFCGKFCEVVKHKMLTATQQQLRNTKKEKFDEILENLYKKVMRRVQGETYASIVARKHIASVELGIFFLDQTFLEKRIDGLKLINEVASQSLTVMKQEKPESDMTESQKAQRAHQMKVNEFLTR